MRIIQAMTLAALLGLAACNTVEGFGQDVQSGGEAVTDTAQDAERSM